MNRRRGWAALLLAALIVTGCSTAPPYRDTPRASTPRVRCLSEPSRDVAEGTRPLLFLFCIESP